MGENRALPITPPSGTVTLMFTDIVGSTGLRDTLVDRHGGKEGDRQYREQFLDPHHARIRACLEQHNGFEVKTIGDSFMVSFESAEDAIRCAVAIQRSLREPGHKVRFRRNGFEVIEQEQPVPGFESASRGYAAVGLVEMVEIARQRAIALAADAP